MCRGLVVSFLAIVLMFSLTGCWSWTPSGKRTQKINVASHPPGATIWQESDKDRKALGQSPGAFEVSYSAQICHFPSWKWIGTVLTAGITVGGIAWLDTEPNVLEDSSGTLGGMIPISMIVFGAMGLIPSLILNILGERQDGTEYIEPLQLGASLVGYHDQSATIEFPFKKEELRFTLSPVPGLAKLQGNSERMLARVESQKRREKEKRRPPKKARQKGQPAIVVVFDVHDAAGQFDRKTIDQLTNYLSTAVTLFPEYRVIPREQLRAHLFSEKRKTYKECFDETCQIELGKALSAQKSLSTHLLQLGTKCVVTANLYDLKTETSEKGAMVETGCSPEDLMNAMKQVAKQLSEEAQ